MPNILNNSGLCLTDEELCDLTDAHVRALQIAWLEAHNWVYELSRIGKPKVARAYFEKRMGVVSGASEAVIGPNWDGLA